MRASDDRLVAAPFVRGVPVGGVLHLRRVDDGGRKLVRDVPAARRLLAAFARPRAPEDHLAGLPEAAHADERAALAALVAAGLLLRVDQIEVPRPSLEVELTNRCNARCVMCPREELRALGTMSPACFDRLIAATEALRPRGVILQGIGEPTLDPALDERLPRLRAALGQEPLVLVTNGFNLTPARVGELLARGLDHVQWSFHSLRPRVYDSIFGVAAFARVRPQIEACLRAHPTAISINFVVMQDNADELEDLRRWVLGLGLPPETIRPVACMSRGGEVDTARLTGGPRVGATSGRCLFVRRALFIAWNGDMLPCSSDIRGSEVIANLADTPPVELLRRWRDRLLVPPPAFAICAGCDHFMRDTSPSGWFDLLAELSLPLPEGER